MVAEDAPAVSSGGVQLALMVPSPDVRTRVLGTDGRPTGRTSTTLIALSPAELVADSPT